jgi:hypothetical protein
MICVFVEQVDDASDVIYGIFEGPDGIEHETLWAQFVKETKAIHSSGHWYAPGTNVPPEEPFDKWCAWYQVAHPWEIDIHDAYVDWIAKQPGWQRLDYQEMRVNDD